VHTVDTKIPALDAMLDEIVRTEISPEVAENIRMYYPHFAKRRKVQKMVDGINEAYNLKLTRKQVSDWYKNHGGRSDG